MCLHLTRKLHAPAHAGVVHQAGQGKAVLRGSIFLPDFQHAETMTLEVEGKEPEVIRCPVDINGFEYEIREASRCVKLGRTGSDRYTPQDSLALTRLMYDTRMSWGMMFAGEV